MQEHIVKSFDSELKDLTDKIVLLGQTCEQQIENALTALTGSDHALAQQTVDKDAQVNELQKEIEEEAIQCLAMRQPVAIDLRQLLSVVKIASKLERIGDYAANAASRVPKLTAAPQPETTDLIVQLGSTCKAMLTEIIAAFKTLDLQKAAATWRRDNEVDTLFVQLVEMTQKQNEDIDDYTQLIFIGRYFERIGDHITNIAEFIYYITTGQAYVDQFSK